MISTDFVKILCRTASGVKSCRCNYQAINEIYHIIPNSYISQLLGITNLPVLEAKAKINGEIKMIKKLQERIGTEAGVRVEIKVGAEAGVRVEITVGAEAGAEVEVGARVVAKIGIGGRAEAGVTVETTGGAEVGVRAETRIIIVVEVRVGVIAGVAVRAEVKANPNDIRIQSLSK